MEEKPYRKWQVIFQAIAILGALIGSGLALLEMSHRFEQEKTVRRDEIEKQLRGPYYQSLIELYLEATRTTGILATQEPSNPDYPQAYRKFGELYYGRMAMLEDKPVASAMIEFGESLWSVKGQRTKQQWKDIQDKALKVASECRLSLDRKLLLDLQVLDLKSVP